MGVTFSSGSRVPDRPDVGVVTTGNGVAGVRYPTSPGAGLAVAVGPLPLLPWVGVEVVLAVPGLLPVVPPFPDPVAESGVSFGGEIHPERQIIATRMSTPAIIILFPVIKGGWCPPLFIGYGGGEGVAQMHQFAKIRHTF